MNGLTPGQRFFLAYANIWRGNIRDQALRVLLTTNPHSPGRYRVLGPLSRVVDGGGAAVGNDDAAELGDEAAPAQQARDLRGLDPVAAGGDDDLESGAVHLGDGRCRRQAGATVCLCQERAPQAEKGAVEVGVD